MLLLSVMMRLRLELTNQLLEIERKEEGLKESTYSQNRKEGEEGEGRSILLMKILRML